MDKLLFVVVILTVGATVSESISLREKYEEVSVAEPVVSTDGWVREYCLNQRNNDDQRTKNEVISEKRRYYAAPGEILRKQFRKKRDSGDAENQRSPVEEDLAVYKAILKLQEYVNTACQKFYDEANTTENIQLQ